MISIVIVTPGKDPLPMGTLDVFFQKINIILIRLPPIYNPIGLSPNDQIQPKLFVSINSTNIYISSGKIVFNRSISMEVRFITLYLSTLHLPFFLNKITNFFWCHSFTRAQYTFLRRGKWVLMKLFSKKGKCYVDKYMSICGLIAHFRI